MNEQGSGNRDQGSTTGERRSGLAGAWNNHRGTLLILLAAVVATLPQLRGNSCGHDFDFHLVGWFDALANWRQGILYPHWSPSSNFGAGEPRFIFYPPISWMAGAALGAVFPWKGVPLALTCLTFAASGLATRALARLRLAEGPATLAGCAAVFSGYGLFTAYERSDFGELMGGFWIPLLLLFLLRDREPEAGAWRRGCDGSAVPLALVLAGAWLSNAPLGVMASYLLAAIALVLALMRRSWAPIVRATLAAALGLGVASFFILPAAYEQRWVDMSQILDDPGYKLEANWIFRHNANPVLDLHDLELFRVSVIGASMLAVALVALAVAWRRRTLPGGLRWWLPLAIVPVVILFLQFPMSDWLWNLLPKARFMEFPWRWYGVLSTPMAIFFAAAVWPTRPAARKWIAAGCALLFVGATAVAGLNFFQPCDEEDRVRAMWDLLKAGAGFVGTDEYEPPWADNTVLAMGLPGACLTSSATAALGEGEPGAQAEWSQNQHTCEATYARVRGPRSIEHQRVNAVTPHAGYLVLRLRSYPAWQIRVNGQPMGALPQREDGLVAVPVAAGAVTVTADWTSTPDVIASRWLTAAAWLLLGGLWFAERKLARPRVS